MSPMRISHVVKGARPITAELALLFGRALGQPPQSGSIRNAGEIRLLRRNDWLGERWHCAHVFFGCEGAMTPLHSLQISPISEPTTP